MAIEFKLIELLNSREILGKLSQVQVKAALAFRLSKIVKVVNEELAKFDEVRLDLFKKYGTKNEASEEIVISEENRTEFMNELNTLLMETVELNIPKLSMDNLNDFSLSTMELLQIEKFVVEEA